MRKPPRPGEREPIRIGTFDQVGAAFVRACPKIGISSLTSDAEVFEIFQPGEDWRDPTEGNSNG